MQLTNVKRKIMSFAIAAAMMLSLTAPTMSVNAAQQVVVNYATISLGDERVAAICMAVMENIKKNYAGVYAFDYYDITVHNQTEAGDVLYVDVDVLVYMTLIRNPEDSPYVMGMKLALDAIEGAAEKEIAAQAYNAYLQKVMPYYNLPVLTGFSYRVYIPTIMILNPEIGFGFDLYHRTSILSKVTEDEQYTELGQYEDGINYMNEALVRAAAGPGNTLYYAPGAVAYAVAYATDVPEYSAANNNGSDCANFVSKCINAGGIPQDIAGNWYQGSINWVRTGFYNIGGVVPYLTGKGYFRPVSSGSRATEGSIMYYNTKSHVAIVTLNDGSTIRYSHHSNMPKSSVYYVYDSKIDPVTFYVPQ